MWNLTDVNGTRSQIQNFFTTKIKKLFTFEQLLRKVPVLEWLPKYRKSYILADIVAGLTVAMTVIPQGIADAALAGLPTQYGLYAGFMGKKTDTFKMSNLIH
jgi:solute carrier family 26 (sodium-independent sulfate anion transporter), member 11